jgi:hypothetical protein
VSSLTWTPGATPAKQPLVRVSLTNVGAVTVLLGGAGIAHGQRATITVITDGATTVHVGSRVWHLTRGPHTLHARG